MERCLVALSGTGIKENDFEICNKTISSQNTSPKLIIFYSNHEDLWYYAKKLREIYPEATSIGCSTYINFSSEGYSDKGLSVMAIYSGVECSCGLIYEISRHPKNYIQHIREALKSLNSTDNTCCLEFTTSGSQGEELVLDTFEEVLRGTNIKVAGSSAGSREGEKISLVALNGDIYINTCAFVFIHNLQGKVELYRENIFRPTSHLFTTTDVDCDERLVYELDNKPIAEVLSKILNIDTKQLEEELYYHPIGRLDGKDIFISVGKNILEDGSIKFYSRIYNQTKVVLLEMDSFESVWDETEINIHKKIEKISFSIAVNCFIRTNIIQQNNKFEEFINKLKKSVGKFIGISGFGEQIMYNHLNQSLVLIMFE